MNFNFGEVLTRAWQIIWKYKILWVFGILASCSRGGSNGGGGGSAARSAGDQIGSSGAAFRLWTADHPGLVILAVVLFIVLVLLFIFLGTIGRIGLIKGTYKVEQGAPRLVLGELFSESVPYFGRVFGLSFLVALIFGIIFVPIALIGQATIGIGYICLLPVICIIGLAGWVVALIVEQANVAIVLEDLSMSAGFRRGWAIVRANIGPALIMAIILGVLGFALSLLIAIPILVVVLPAAFTYSANTESSIPLVFMSACLCLYLPIAIFLQGILASYIQSAWTLTYMRLTARPDDNTPPTAPVDVDPIEPQDSEKTIIAAKPNA